MTSFARHVLLIAGRSLVLQLRSRAALFFAAGHLLFGLLVGLIFLADGDRGRQDELFAFPGLLIFIQILVPVTSVYFSVAAVRSEIADRTLTYLLTAPVRRAAIWLGKFLASTATAMLLASLGFAAAAAAAELAPVVPRPGRALHASTVRAFLWAVCAAPPAYAALGTLLGVRFKRAMMAGAFFVFLWEGFAGSTPAAAGVRRLTVVDGVRTLVARSAVDAERFRRALVFWSAGGDYALRVRWFEDPAGAFDEAVPRSGDALRGLAWFTAICLLLALVSGARRDYESAPKD